MLEVLIALILFTFMAVTLMRMTDKTLKYQKKITRNVKDIKFRRNVFQIIRADIRNSFYISDINSFLHQPLSKRTNKAPFREEEGSTAPGGLKSQLEAFEEKEIRPYLYHDLYSSGSFIGTQDRLRITSFSYVPGREDENADDRNIVVYYLKDCKSRKNNKIKSLCLWRRFSPDINQDTQELKDYEEFALLERVKKFQLSYYSISTNEWTKEWKTGPKDQNILPSAVHIIIEFEDKKKQLVKNEIKIPVYQQFILPVQRN